MGPKVPHQLSKETVSLSRHITVPITVNALGNAAVLFSPFYLKDDIAITSTLFINTDPLYNGVNLFGAGYTNTPTPLIIPFGNVTSYRLVSASMHIVPQMSLTNSKGKIGGCITDAPILPGTIPGNTGTLNQYSVIANIESMRPYAEADVCVPESLRLVWYPYDNNDLCLYDIDTDLGLNVAARENVLAAYITQAPLNTGTTLGLGTFNVELFWNFEVTPTAGSIISGMGTFASETIDPIGVLHRVKSQPMSLAHSYVATTHKHEADGRSFALSTGNPKKDAAGGVIDFKPAYKIGNKTAYYG